ncbi:MAG: zinc ribbon domain-containing protein [Pseudomonadota bacterium]
MSSASNGNCDRCHCDLEHGDLRCPVCALPVPAQPESTESGALRSLRCDDCGAPMHFDVQRQGARCPFCGGVAKLEQGQDPVERAEQVVPFSVDRSRARVALRRWLGKRRWLAPGDLASRSALEKTEAVHWAAWVLDADSTVSWTAESDAGARKSTWAPHAGQCELSLDGLLVSASRGLRDDEVQGLGDYDLRVTSASQNGTSVQEDYGVPRSAARAQILRAVHDRAEAHVQAQEVPGRRSRRIRIELLLRSLTTRRILLPAWVLAYRYRGKVFRAVLHGQDSERVIGTVPLSPWRVLALVLGLVALLAALVAVKFFLLDSR